MPIDRRTFIGGLLGLGGAVATAEPVRRLWRAGDTPAGGAALNGSSVPLPIEGRPVPSTVFFSTGGEFSAASDDLTLARSRMEAHGLLANGDPGDWWESELCPVEFVQVYRDPGSPDRFSATMQRDVPVGFYDDGGGKLRIARAQSFVTYFVDRQTAQGSAGLALTVGQTQYDSLALAEVAIFKERTVFHPYIANTHTKRTAIIAKANVLDLSDCANVAFIQDVRGPGRMS